LCLVLPALGAEYRGLKPGVSTKADADRVLGAPIQEVRKGVRYDYPVKDEDALRVSIAFSPGSLVIETIDLYQVDLYDKAQYREWFKLGEPAKSEKDAQEHLVEYYLPQGIALHYLGGDSSTQVEYFSHFSPRRLGGGSSEPSPKPDIGSVEDWLAALESEIFDEEEGSAFYYVIQSIRAVEKKDCRALKQIIDKSLEDHPETAEFWRLKFNYLRRCNQPPYKSVEDEIEEAAGQAFELDPSPWNAFNLGWVCQVLGGTYPNALVWYTLAEKDPTFNDPSLFFFMAQCYEQLRRTADAASYYERFLQAAPSHPQAGEARQRLGQLKLRR
jgi:tetratricopeptide (TPR) repeat protein